MFLLGGALRPPCLTDLLCCQRDQSGGRTFFFYIFLFFFYCNAVDNQSIRWSLAYLCLRDGRHLKRRKQQNDTNMQQAKRQKTPAEEEEGATVPGGYNQTTGGKNTQPVDLNRATSRLLGFRGTPCPFSLLRIKPRDKANTVSCAVFQENRCEFQGSCPLFCQIIFLRALSVNKSQSDWFR